MRTHASYTDPLGRAARLLLSDQELSANLLVVANKAAAGAYLRQLQPSMRRPVRTASPRKLHLPSGGTLVVRDIDELSAEQQSSLNQWLDRDPSVMVISVSSQPLFPLVAVGLFDERLYYRLNVTLVELSEIVAATPYVASDQHSHDGATPDYQNW